jgi:hypothetical protein
MVMDQYDMRMERYWNNNYYYAMLMKDKDFMECGYRVNEEIMEFK